VEHIKNWRSHLKRERLRCNRCLSCRANMPVRSANPWTRSVASSDRDIS